MHQIKCSICRMLFDVDESEDHRPFFYHVVDGETHFTRNPGFNRFTQKRWVVGYPQSHTGRRNVGEYSE